MKNLRMVLHLMNLPKVVVEYIEFVSNNPDAISNDIKKLIENVVIPTFDDENTYFDEETFNRCISFCERWFYPLFPFQKFRYAMAFVYRKDNPDIVIFKEQFDLMGRGNGKDGYLIPLALFMLTPMYGVNNYNIDIVATSEEQAINSFDVAYNMLEENKKVMRKLFYWNKTEIICKQTKSKMRYNTSNAKTKDGKQTGMIIFNELHAYEDYKQINVFSSGLGKIKHARTWTITTNGVVRDGPLDEKISTAESVLNGEVNMLSMFPFLNRIDSKLIDKPMKKYLETFDENDIDITVWEQSNPSLRYMPVLKEQVITDYVKMLKTPSFKTEFYAKRMNRPMQRQEQTVTSWENILKASYSDVTRKIGRSQTVKNGSAAIVGIDFASFNDFASAGFLFEVDGETIWIQKTWICSRSKFFKEMKFPFDNIGQEGFKDFEVLDHDYIDERHLVGWVYENMMKYNVKKIVLDSHRFLLLKAAFEEYGITVESRDNKDGMVRMIRLNNSVYNIVAPQIEKLFIEGKINIGNSAMMRWAINNTAMKRGKDGSLSFDKIEPKLRKNDPFMAFVHAMQAKELLKTQVITLYM